MATATKEPKNVRNFFLTGQVDGVATPIGTGPSAKDGGFVLNILYREDGKVSTDKVIITGTVEGNKLVLRVDPTVQTPMGFELIIDR